MLVIQEEPMEEEEDEEHASAHEKDGRGTPDGREQ